MHIQNVKSIYDGRKAISLLKIEKSAPAMHYISQNSSAKKNDAQYTNHLHHSWLVSWAQQNINLTEWHSSPLMTLNAKWMIDIVLHVWRSTSGRILHIQLCVVWGPAAQEHLAHVKFIEKVSVMMSHSKTRAITKLSCNKQCRMGTQPWHVNALARVFVMATVEKNNTFRRDFEESIPGHSCSHSS